MAFDPPWLLAPRRPHGAGARTTRGGALHQPGGLTNLGLQRAGSRTLGDAHLSHPLRWLRCVCVPDDTSGVPCLLRSGVDWKVWGERAFAPAAGIDTPAVLMSTFMFLGCRGWDAPVMMPAPSTGSFSRFCIFLHLYLLIISNIDPTKIDDPKPDPKKNAPKSSNCDPNFPAQCKQQCIKRARPPWPWTQ